MDEKQLEKLVLDYQIAVDHTTKLGVVGPRVEAWN